MIEVKALCEKDDKAARTSGPRAAAEKPSRHALHCPKRNGPQLRAVVRLA